jgi:hypothetical protein
MRRAIKDIKLASPGPEFYFPRLCSADRARCRVHELKSSYDLPMQLLTTSGELTPFGHPYGHDAMWYRSACNLA